MLAAGILLAAAGGVARAGSAAAEPAAEGGQRSREARPASSPVLLLDGAYPLEAVASFPAALLHWLDSLAALSGPGLTAGKTQEAHRRAWVGVHGPPTPSDVELLERFRDARLAFLRERGERGRDALTAAFFGALEIDAACRASNALLDPREATDLVRAVDHFAPRDTPIWQRAGAPRASSGAPCAPMRGRRSGRSSSASHVSMESVPTRSSRRG